MMQKNRRLLLLIGIILLLPGCTGTQRQSALDPAGTQAAHIHGLWDLYLWTCCLVYLAVMACTLVAFFRRAETGTDEPVTAPPIDQELRKGAIVTGALFLTAAILFVLLLSEFLTARQIDALADPKAPTVRITGHQWWWDVRYENPTASEIVQTANELHLPVGRTIHFELLSSDVIHSLWIPNLHGKTDMIPGYTTQTFVRADQPGTFWGQCAEFCGHQHANMRLLIVVEPEEEFQKWLAAQRQPAPAPTTESQKRGQQLFLTRTCVLCHTINGTPAQSRVGPELTHLATRPRIGAGTLPNNRGHLAGWITDPQGIKPGVRMPATPLTTAELHPLLDYLESLK